ncbi:MAG: bifunctional 4-hydroxy-3-methylbut-2-enyl diphosphate reductase/30S ribosomal protein S1 [Oscillospiraceae bacterium]|nr:bifunctional 4-hydroxy-3-methylbut-2-enyl diphosphate reductase/30S ribosomal protein S1 [Oscillospiraceae bacterium]
MKEIRVAKSAGFCFGVSRSVDMAEKLLDEHGRACSLGPIIHNEDVVGELCRRGLRVLASPAEAAAGEQVMIRAHGAAPSVYRELEERGAVITDATCPKVKMIHRIVREAAEEGRFVIVIGMRRHPEVEAICGWCGEHVVLENPAETRLWMDENPNYFDKMITIVVQTTQTSGNFTECCEILKKRCTNLKISDTICLATSTRQEEAKTLSSQCGAMVVIGGKHSANSLHLAEICASLCPAVQFIERSEELDLAALRDVDVVGITAGASTPAWIIKEVRNKMSDEIIEIKAEEPAVEKEQSFDEMLEETLKPIYNGDKVSGVVVAITATEVSIDLGTKYSGFIPTTEFTEDGTKIEDAVKVGDPIEAIVVRVNDVEGTAQLSKKRLDAVKVWDDVEQAVESGEVIEGVVTETNKGGVVVSYKGVRVFVPASQTDLPREADLSELVKKTVRFKLTEVNKARKRVVGSIRRVAQAERRAATEAIWNEIEVGKKYHGVVKSLTSYGAFVDIGGIDGMVHVSELSWARIHQPSEVVSVGDEIDVYVISFDREKRKISLGYKDPEANPWTVFTNRYSVGDVASVTIVKLMEFGAFATVVPGVDGLIHISQIANRRIEKPGDVLTVGDIVEAKITAIDEEKHKVSLSIRALSAPAPAAPVEEPAAEEEQSGEDVMVYDLSASGEAVGEVPADPDEA